jgi:hypothetical protein
MLPSPTGLIVASYDAGLTRIAPDGCSSEPLDAPLSGRHVVDLAAAAESSRLLALLAPTQEELGGLLISEDSGATWTAGAEMSAFGTALRVAPSNENRVYITAQLATDDGVPVHQLLVSSDAGATYVPQDLALSDTEVRAFVLGVDPLDEARVFVRTLPGNSDMPERLLLSEDGGESFSEVYASGGPLAFAVDQNAAWLGGKDGLFRSNDRGKTFEPVPGAPDHIGCLVARSDSLSVCGFADNEFGVLQSTPDQQSFETELRFADVTDQVSCASDSEIYARCQVEFQHWAEEVARPSEGGAAGAGGPSDQAAGTSSRGDPPSSGGCRAAGSGAGSSRNAALGLLLACAWRRLAGRRKEEPRRRAPRDA